MRSRLQDGNDDNVECAGPAADRPPSACATGGLRERLPATRRAGWRAHAPLNLWAQGGQSADTSGSAAGVVGDEPPHGRRHPQPRDRRPGVHRPDRPDPDRLTPTPATGGRIRVAADSTAVPSIDEPISTIVSELCVLS